MPPRTKTNNASCLHLFQQFVLTTFVIVPGRNNSHKGTAYFRCFTEGCKGRASLRISDPTHLVESKVHNHAPDKMAQKRFSIRHGLMKAAQISTKSLMSLFKYVSTTMLCFLINHSHAPVCSTYVATLPPEDRKVWAYDSVRKCKMYTYSRNVVVLLAACSWPVS